ncbi:MAG: hypothetical protein HQ568_05690 [Calditrichaeota bacterium]|nr:hypothetical protein [Calditrichota bacterium]
MDVLVRIKRLVIDHKVVFTEKAEIELVRDQLTRRLVFEAILNAPAIMKTLRSRNPFTGKREYLYVIVGLTFNGITIYTKGKLIKHNQEEQFYVLISSKQATN